MRVSRSGKCLGPDRIYTSGPYISDAPRWQPEADEAWSAWSVEQKRAGYDLIKTHGDFSREAFHRLLFAVARAEGIKVIGHAPRNLGVEAMFEEHMDAVAHSEEVPLRATSSRARPNLSEADPATRRQASLETARDSRIPELAAATAKAGMRVIPNLVAYKMIVDQGKDLAVACWRGRERRYVPPERCWPTWQPGLNR